MRKAERKRRREVDPEFRERDRLRSKERYERTKGTRTAEERERKRVIDREAKRRAWADPVRREAIRRRQRERNLATAYGISIAMFDAMCEAQSDRCAICATPDAGGKYGIWHVDHCHTTGKVRGLLCSDCNLGLGRFYDDPVRLASAIEYLARYAA